MTDANPETIRESILDFTAHFGEINTAMPYLVNEIGRGP